MHGCRRDHRHPDRLLDSRSQPAGPHPGSLEEGVPGLLRHQPGQQRRHRSRQPTHRKDPPDRAGPVRGGTRPAQGPVRTTLADPSHPRAPDRLHRDFTALAPNRVWVADFTEVLTWAGIVYLAFILDVYSRGIVGWRPEDYVFGVYKLETRSCVTYCLDVWRAGGVEGVPDASVGWRRSILWIFSRDN
jgi:transposase InsO family protein